MNKSVLKQVGSEKEPFRGK